MANVESDIVERQVHRAQEAAIQAWRSGAVVVDVEGVPPAPRDLTDHRALAAIIGIGTARNVLRSLSDLQAVARAGDAELLLLGVTPRKLATLRSAIELGIRVTAAPVVGQRLAGPEDAAAYFSRLALEPIEEFHAAVLDVRHRVTKDLLIGRGSLTGVEVHPRDVFRALIRAGAAAVIFAHNHPSGDPLPSGQDVTLTARLRGVGELVGIPVLDHIVVAAGGRWSRVESR